PEECRRAPASQDGVQGYGRGPPVPGAGTARTQEDRRRGGEEEIGEDPHGPESPRVLHEVPGVSRPVGPRGRGRLPPARGGVTMRRIPSFFFKAAGCLPVEQPTKIELVINLKTA